MAETITWTPSMSVGVVEIDNQHKEFIKIISDFYNAFEENKLKTELENTLKKLIEYADFHFKTEEAYFDKFDYEFKDEHKKEHEKIRQKALLFLERFKEEGADIVIEFMEFITDWLVDHLEEQDQKYVKCFHDHGLF